MKRSVTARFVLLLSCLVWPNGAEAQNAAEGAKLYASYCATCHGDTGKGDGVAARSLPVKPRDHTDSAVMKQLTDQALANVILKGGSAVGKSAFMPAWGASLNEGQVRDIVAYIRTLASPARP